LADSLKNQTFKNYELIIVDDHPIDRRNLVKSYLEDQGIPVAYIGHCKPKCFPEIAYNLANAINTGFLLSTKEIVIYLQDYQWLSPDCLEKMAGHEPLFKQNYCVILPGRLWDDYRPRNNRGLISIWDAHWQGKPENQGCQLFSEWVPEAWEFACIALPWNVIAEANGFPECYDSYGAHPYEPLAKRFEAAGGKPYTDKDNFMEMINHRGWLPHELWLASMRAPAGSTEFIERENCFDLKKHTRGKPYWVGKPKEDIFQRPEYWCGELGYRPGPGGIGYRDFPIHQTKVDYILSTDPRGKVMDIGCAMGYIVGRLRKAGVDAWGVDISRYALSHAPEEVKPYLKLASADSLPFHDKEFDMAISFSVFEHLPPGIVAKAIAEVVRVANRGIISVTPGDDPHFDEDVTHQTKQPLSWWRAQFPPQFEVRSDADEEWLRAKIPEVYLHRIEWVRSKADLEDTILEVGCAENPVWKDTSFKVTTLDKQVNPELNIFPNVQGEAEKLPFEDNSFDVVAEGELLEHAADPHQVLREAARVTKKKVIITVPNEFLWPPELKPFENPGHVRFYSKSAFIEELGKINLPFRVESILWGPWAWLGGEILCGEAKAKVAGSMEWANYPFLAIAEVFLITARLLNIETAIGREILDSLHTTRRLEYPWVYINLQPFTKDDIVLEAGAGPTALQFYLSRMVKEVHNVDIYPDWIEWVSKVKKESSFPNLFPVLGDLTEMTFPSNHFDKAICVSVLEHLPKDKVIAGIEELIRVTKPGGKIAITMDVVLEKTDKQTDLEDFGKIAEKYSFKIPSLPPHGMISRVPPYNFPFAVACILLEKGG